MIDLIVNVCWCLPRSTMKCPNFCQYNSYVQRASIAQSTRDARWPWCTLVASFVSFRRHDFLNLAVSLETISVHKNISTDYLHKRQKQMSKDLVFSFTPLPSHIRLYGIDVTKIILICLP